MFGFFPQAGASSTLNNFFFFCFWKIIYVWVMYLVLQLITVYFRLSPFLDTFLCAGCGIHCPPVEVVVILTVQSTGSSSSLFISQFAVSWTSLLVHPWSSDLKAVFGIQFNLKNLVEMPNCVYPYISCCLEHESDSAVLLKFHTVTVKGDNQITAEPAEAFAVVIRTGSKAAVVTRAAG